VSDARRASDFLRNHEDKDVRDAFRDACGAWDRDFERAVNAVVRPAVDRARKREEEAQASLDRRAHMKEADAGGVLIYMSIKSMRETHAAETILREYTFDDGVEHAARLVSFATQEIAHKVAAGFLAKRFKR
jgi:hypothetical protein